MQIPALALARCCGQAGVAQHNRCVFATALFFSPIMVDLLFFNLSTNKCKWCFRNLAPHHDRPVMHIEALNLKVKHDMAAVAHQSHSICHPDWHPTVPAEPMHVTRGLQHTCRAICVRIREQVAVSAKASKRGQHPAVAYSNSAKLI